MEKALLENLRADAVFALASGFLLFFLQWLLGRFAQASILKSREALILMKEGQSVTLTGDHFGGVDRMDLLCPLYLAGMITFFIGFQAGVFDQIEGIPTWGRNIAVWGICLGFFNFILAWVFRSKRFKVKHMIPQWAGPLSLLQRRHRQNWSMYLRSFSAKHGAWIFAFATTFLIWLFILISYFPIGPEKLWLS